MSRRVKKEDLDYEVIEEMKEPKLELMKEILEKKYFDDHYKNDLSIRLELHLSERCFYNYLSSALKLYDWTESQNCTNHAVFKRH